MGFGSKNYRRRLSGVVLAIVLGCIVAGALPAFGHGGKSHGGSGFSALQAVQKATQLYDRLITSSKLPEAWETGLSTIIVKERKKGDRHEYVVRFQRSGGDPASVYFFFDAKGEYSGSNFTGE